MKNLSQMWPAGMFLVICLMTASTWIFARFVTYHAQNRILSPANYVAEVIPVGSVEANERNPVDFRESEDGRYYVRVVTLGTAQCVVQATLDLLPPFVTALIGLVISVVILRRRTTMVGQ